MEILQFARLADVDPIYFETSYFSIAQRDVFSRDHLMIVRTDHLLPQAMAALPVNFIKLYPRRPGRSK
jgi:non-homologous end joining protein Ku